MGGTCKIHEEHKSTQNFCPENLKERDLLGTPSRRCKYNIKIDLKTSEEPW